MHKLHIRLLLLGGLAIHGSFLQAQNTDYVDSSQVQVLADTGKSYLVPDLSHKQMKWTNIGNKYFTLQLGFVMLFDYDQNIQDEDSKTQVGKQESRFDLRSARVMARGKINFKNPWSYLISLEYKGLDRGDDVNAFGFTDLKLLVPLSKHSELTFGKIKETFVYEMVGDAANLPQSERILNPFFASRNTGIVYRHFLLNDRMTISGGWFNNWLAKGGSLSESVNTYTARVTGLPKWVNNGKQFMHMGVSIRYLGAQNGMERLQGKNESNVSTNYVDTKSFSASHQLNLGFEQLWSLENFSVLFEYVHNWTKTPTGSEQFSGSYVTGSYVISGEQRPYDKKAGYARRIKPTGKSGAWEIIARISKLDLDNRDIHGGINNRYTFGLNWWATQYWKAGMTYGITNLLKDNILGVTNSFQFRIQWIF